MPGAEFKTKENVAETQTRGELRVVSKGSRSAWPGTLTAARFVPPVLALVTAIPLFGPSALVSRLGLLELVSRYRAALGITCLVSGVVVLVAQVLPAGFAALRRQLTERWRQRNGRKRLQELTRSEKNLLKQYVTRETRTLVLDPSSSATSALLLSGIISRAVELDDKALGLAFNIESWAWVYLKSNRQLLETSEVSSPRLRASGQGPAAGSRDPASRPVT